MNFLFSDKTGTLTKNIMIFKSCSINGKMYSQQGRGLKENGRNYSLKVGECSVCKSYKNLSHVDFKNYDAFNFRKPFTHFLRLLQFVTPSKLVANTMKMKTRLMKKIIFQVFTLMFLKSSKIS